MKLEEIKGIIKLVADANLHKVELEQQDIKIRLIRSSQQQAHQLTTIGQQTVVNEVQSSPVSALQELNEAINSHVDDSIITIKSTLIGTYCSAPAKDKPAFVRPGKQIKVGEPICSIKALNLFNEVEAQVAGTIEEVLVKDGDAVEYDQPLFLVKVKS